MSCLFYAILAWILATLGPLAGQQHGPQIGGSAYQTCSAPPPDEEGSTGNQGSASRPPDSDKYGRGRDNIYNGF